jgi:hypothetical protein
VVVGVVAWRWPALGKLGPLFELEPREQVGQV